MPYMVWGDLLDLLLSVPRPFNWMERYKENYDYDEIHYDLVIPGYSGEGGGRGCRAFSGEWVSLHRILILCCYIFLNVKKFIVMRTLPPFRFFRYHI